MIPQKTLAESSLNEEYLGAMKESLGHYPDAIGIILYSNHDLSSQFVGHEVCLPFGPSNTVRSLEHAAQLKTYPFRPPIGSNWQYYPDGWIARAEFFPEAAALLPGWDKVETSTE